MMKIMNEDVRRKINRVPWDESFEEADGGAPLLYGREGQDARTCTSGCTYGIT